MANLRLLLFYFSTIFLLNSYSNIVINMNWIFKGPLKKIFCLWNLFLSFFKFFLIISYNSLFETVSDESTIKWMCFIFLVFSLNSFKLSRGFSERLGFISCLDLHLLIWRFPAWSSNRLIALSWYYTRGKM